MTGSHEGIRFLDHTADVGMDVIAPSLEALFRRAAAGMAALLRGADDELEVPDRPAPGEAGGQQVGAGQADAGPRELVEVTADDVTGLLAAWLKELLYLHETRGVEIAGAVFDRLTDTALVARVATRAAAPVREIKGVTHHELTVERAGEGWRARVIFDV
ncbi:MAG: archease [Gemmatimonadota bacterium]